MALKQESSDCQLRNGSGMRLLRCVAAATSEPKPLNHVVACLFEVVVVSYSRKQLGQTGDGHYSPIGGYHRASDQVLILDVARFKRRGQL